MEPFGRANTDIGLPTSEVNTQGEGQGEGQGQEAAEEGERGQEGQGLVTGTGSSLGEVEFSDFESLMKDGELEGVNPFSFSSSSLPSPAVDDVTGIVTDTVNGMVSEIEAISTPALTPAPVTVPVTVGAFESVHEVQSPLLLQSAALEENEQKEVDGEEKQEVATLTAEEVKKKVEVETVEDVSSTVSVTVLDLGPSIPAEPVILSFEEFCVALNGHHNDSDFDPSSFCVWSVKEDEVICLLVNSLSDRLGLDPLMIPAGVLEASRRERGLLGQRTACQVEVRYAALCVLNKVRTSLGRTSHLKEGDQFMMLRLSIAILETADLCMYACARIGGGKATQRQFVSVPIILFHVTSTILFRTGCIHRCAIDRLRQERLQKRPREH